MRLSLNDQITLIPPQRIWRRSGKRALKLNNSKTPNQQKKVSSSPAKPDASITKILSVFSSFRNLFHEKELQYFVCLI